jgi:hypothetical protein
MQPNGSLDGACTVSASARMTASLSRIVRVVVLLMSCTWEASGWPVISLSLAAIRQSLLRSRLVHRVRRTSQHHWLAPS